MALKTLSVSCLAPEGHIQLYSGDQRAGHGLVVGLALELGAQLLPGHRQPQLAPTSPGAVGVLARAGPAGHLLPVYVPGYLGGRVSGGRRQEAICDLWDWFAPSGLTDQ